MSESKADPQSAEIIEAALAAARKRKEQEREKILYLRAHTPDKEPFDGVRLGEFYSTTEGCGGDTTLSPEATQEHEARYYIKHPEFKTLKEYGEDMTRSDRLSGG